MKKLIAIVALALTLGGCTADQIIANVQHILGQVEADIGLAEAAIANNCAAVQMVQADVEALASKYSATCKARTSIAKETAAINSVCRDASLINATNASAISVQVSGAYKAVKTAQAGGC